MVRGKGNDDNDNNLGDYDNDTNLVKWIEYRIEHDKIIIILHLKKNTKIKIWGDIR